VQEQILLRLGKSLKQKQKGSWIRGKIQRKII